MRSVWRCWPTPGHPEHDERLEWMGGEFDAAHVDGDLVSAAINPVLRKAQKREKAIPGKP